MDFSSKQAFGVAIVAAVAGLVLAAAILLTISNNNSGAETSEKLWEQTSEQIGQ